MNGLGVGLGLGEELTAEVVELNPAVAAVEERSPHPALNPAQNTAVHGIDVVAGGHLAEAEGATTRAARIFP